MELNLKVDARWPKRSKSRTTWPQWVPASRDLHRGSQTRSGVIAMDKHQQHCTLSLQSTFTAAKLVQSTYLEGESEWRIKMFAGDPLPQLFALVPSGDASFSLPSKLDSVEPSFALPPLDEDAPGIERLLGTLGRESVSSWDSVPRKNPASPPNVEEHDQHIHYSNIEPPRTLPDDIWAQAAVPEAGPSRKTFNVSSERCWILRKLIHRSTLGTKSQHLRASSPKRRMTRSSRCSSRTFSYVLFSSITM